MSSENSNIILIYYYGVIVFERLEDRVYVERISADKQISK